MRSKSALVAECLTSASRSGLGGRKAGKLDVLGGRFCEGPYGDDYDTRAEGLHSEFWLEAFV